jgi:hypothetical protein
VQHEDERIKKYCSLSSEDKETLTPKSDKLLPTQLTRPLFSQVMTSNALTGLIYRKRRIIWGQDAIHGETTSFPGPGKQTSSQGFPPHAEPKI